MAPDLEPFVHSPLLGESVRVIIQTLSSKRELEPRISLRGGRLGRALPLINGFVAEVPSTSLIAFATDGDTMLVSLDRPTTLLGRYDQDLLRVTTGAANVIGRTGISDRSSHPAIDNFLGGLEAGPNGSGLTIAVLDSGLYDHDSLHEDLRVINNPASTRVVARQDFTSDDLNASWSGQKIDPFGHGTHVAGIAAGSGRESLEAEDVGNYYGGLAFNAKLVDLRVIGADGSGYISSAISAVDWMVHNRQRHNIRIANLSIGAAVTQSFRTDPFCTAIERAVRSGIVCVVAAGNFGKDDEGRTIYGGILAPANSPYVITVGAANTQGSIERSDDAIASYSSRGPTLVDNIAKPDLVAPGTLIRSISADENYLAVNHGLTVYSREGRSIYMWLSGTSMAAPVVSGTVALMLQVNPDLTPAMVKGILQFTAQSLASLEDMDPLLRLLTEGAGLVNADAAVRLAASFDSNADRARPGSNLLTNNEPALDRLLYSSRDHAAAPFTSQIAGETVAWGNNIMFSHGLAFLYNRSGNLSVYNTTGWQVAPDFRLFYGFLSTNARLLVDARLMADARLLADGRLASDARLISDARLMTDGRLASDAWFWSGDETGLTNTSVARGTWSSALMDQGVLASGLTFDQRAEHERLMAWGDEAPGVSIPTIQGRRHPLYPRFFRITD